MENDPSTEFENETSKINFIGRNNSINCASAIFDDKELTSNHKDLIDPIMSIRKKVTVKSGSEVTLYMIYAFGKSKEQIEDIINAYNSDMKIFQLLSIKKIYLKQIY